MCPTRFERDLQITGITQMLFDYLFLSFYWSVVDLRCCVSFRCESVVHVNQLYMYVYPLYFFKFFSSHRSLQSAE